MIKRTLLSIGFVAATVCLQAQNAKSVYINIPDTLSALLTKVNREDFADFLQSKMKANVQNRFDKNSEMKVLTDDYLFVQTTPSSTFQFKLLPINDSTRVICTIKTFCGPACDSEIHFYSMNWKELPTADFLTMPEQRDFFNAVDTTQEDDFIMAVSPITMDLIQADLSKDDQMITFAYTTPQTLGEEDLQKLQQFLKKNPLKMVWEKGHFVAAK